MPDTPTKLAEHYRKLSIEEVAMAKLALTNEARARRYARPRSIGSARMQRAPVTFRMNPDGKSLPVTLHLIRRLRAQ
jgi:hypothetical protein